MKRRILWSWSLFDWANSPFPTLVSTFVFATYFSKAIAPTPEAGAAAWGWATGLAGLAVALLAPVLGCAADRMGRRKPWLAFFVLLCMGATAMLWFATPGPQSLLWAAAWMAVATVAFEMTMVYYNAMLPDIAPPAKIGQVSGLAWGLGYAGGLMALVVALYGLIDLSPPPFGLDPQSAGPVRATMLLTALWLGVFSLPLFLWVPDVPAREGWSTGWRLARHDLAGLWRTLRAHPAVGRFLLAQMIYTDGLNTLFAFGGIYAASRLGLEMSEVLMLGIALNVTAGIGAAAFGWLDDRIGARKVVSASLVALLLLAGSLLLTSDRTIFLALAVTLGLFFGPVQSSSRSLMARLAPAESTTEMFGLFALSGKVSAFAGPMILAWVTQTTGSQQAGMVSILVFLLAGLVLLQRVPLPRRQE